VPEGGGSTAEVAGEDGRRTCWSRGGGREGEVRARGGLGGAGPRRGRGEINRAEVGRGRRQAGAGDLPVRRGRAGRRVRAVLGGQVGYLACGDGRWRWALGLPRGALATAATAASAGRRLGRTLVCGRAGAIRHARRSRLQPADAQPRRHQHGPGDQDDQHATQHRRTLAGQLPHVDSYQSQRGGSIRTRYYTRAEGDPWLLPRATHAHRS
jgi:hypothetical protein